MPKLSIITINYNNLEGLQRTFQSVWSQNYQQFEYIIIDGGSTDGSLELILSNTDKFNYWVSEPDKGVFNAQNKGWQKSTGEYLLFLNSGDELFSPETLSEVLAQLDGTDIVYGSLVKVETDREWIKKYDKPLSLHYFYWDTLPHQGSFIRKRLLDELGGFDESMKLAGDWKFFLTAVCRMNATHRHINLTIARYDMQGMTALADNQEKLRLEREHIWLSEWKMQYATIQLLMEHTLSLEKVRKRLGEIVDSPVYTAYKKLKAVLKR